MSLFSNPTEYFSIHIDIYGITDVKVLINNPVFESSETQDEVIPT